MSMPVIEARDLQKSYDETRAVRGVSFEVEPGTVFGLVGTNGAGKSTTIGMLLGLVQPTGGRSSIYGEPSLEMSRATRRRIGYLSERELEDHGLPLRDLLVYVSSFFETWDWDRTQSLCKRLQLDDSLPLHQMSAGQRRRAELAVTLAQDPDLLVLDDPAVGLDATIRRDFLWGALEAARDAGKTVLFTSHVLHDVERVVDRIGIMRDGELVELSDLDALQQRCKRLVIEQPSTASQVPAIAGELHRHESGTDLVVVTRQFGDDVMSQLPGFDVSVEPMNLEDIFCAIVEETRVEETRIEVAQ